MGDGRAEGSSAIGDIISLTPLRDLTCEHLFTSLEAGI